jgi:hypothetical protein
VISVFGASTPKEGQDDYDLAFRVGRALGSRGFSIANGGYGGSMEASARGVREAGGEAIGVVCKAWSSKPNAHLDRVEHTESLPERMWRLVELGQAGYVVLPGGTGTLVELATIWEHVAKGFMPRRPIVCVEEFWTPVVETMGRVRSDCVNCITLARTPEQIAASFPSPTPDRSRT